MIKLHSLVIEEFRGIRKLRLDFTGKNFAVHGPNGTGKSGVVDAIEFALTGNITRLTGQGTSNISLKAHAPHVDQRSAPEHTRVILQAFVPSLNKNITIERRITNPSTPCITPDEPDVQKVVAELALHPEFALTRREIIKYVLVPPGERAKEVQALLRLEEIEKVRQSLQSIHNSAKGDAKRAEQEANQAQLQLVRALGIPVLRRDELLKAVNQRRELLGLEALTDLTANTSLKVGMGGTASAATKLSIPKKQAAADVASLATRLAATEKSELTKARDDTKAALETLVQSPALLRSLKTEHFLRSGLDLVEDDHCPFCDREWDVSALRKHIEGKLEQAKTASALRRKILSSSQALVVELLDLVTVANETVKYGKALPEPLLMQAVTSWIETLRNKREVVTSASDIEGSIAITSNPIHEHPAKVDDEIAELQTRISSLPDVSQEDEAKEFLTVAQERMDVYREARRQHDRSNKQSEVSGKILTVFNESANTVLTGIYHDVQEDFSNFYKFVNREDEATFSGRLVPSFGKLAFDVDFYGRGFFPPGAYHSEGHQDSMGICLYLALMRHMLGGQFTFAVLDDILMSVDSGHRREVCSLLKSQFPDTQFIVTTHDEIWLNHLKTEQLITGKAYVQFRKWTVDDGPHVWEGIEVWQEIQNDLDNNDVPGAAQTLRRYLEYISSQLSSKLRASMEYRADAQHDLGELLPAVVGAWNSLLSRAKDVAQSWGKKDEIGVLSQRQSEFGQRVDKTNIERWPINKAIHYNEWVSLQKQDFLPVVEAFKNLLDALRCSKCQSLMYVIPVRGEIEGLRCDCGSVNINLKKRPKQPSAPAAA